MANYTIQKRVLMRGDKGDTGGGGIDTTVPQAGIIAYKGDEIPEGYILYSEVPDGVLTHITATYTQTATITDASSLDELRPDLVVKAYYYDAETGTTSDYVITDYTLSGTLEVGTSTITASYKGFSDNFDVTVEESIEYLYKWDYTRSLIDEVQGVETRLFGGAVITEGVGLVFSNEWNRVIIGYNNIDVADKTIEVDFTDYEIQTGSYTKLLLTMDFANTFGMRWYNNTNYEWRAYKSNWLNYTTPKNNDLTIFRNKTAKFVFTSTLVKVYSDTELIYEGETFGKNGQITIGMNDGRSISNMTVTGLRIYANQ